MAIKASTLLGHLINTWPRFSFSLFTLSSITRAILHLGHQIRDKPVSKPIRSPVQATPEDQLRPPLPERCTMLGTLVAGTGECDRRGERRERRRTKSYSGSGQRRRQRRQRKRARAKQGFPWLIHAGIERHSVTSQPRCTKWQKYNIFRADTPPIALHGDGAPPRPRETTFSRSS
jgi:hypothetical protein